MVSFDDLIPKQASARKSLSELTPVERAAMRGSMTDQVGAAIVGAGQAASFNLGDELTAALRSLPAYLQKDVDFADSYAKILEKNRQDIKQTEQENPNAFLAGQVLGAVGAGAGSAGTKAGQAIANSLRTGGIGMRATKAGVLGAATGAAAGFGAGSGAENRLESARDSAVVGGLVGGAIPAVGAGVSRALEKSRGAAQVLGRGINARDAEQLDNAIDAIKARSSAAYKQMRDAGAILNKPRAVNITNKVEQALLTDGKLNANLHSNTLSVLDDFKAAARQGDFTLEDLDQWRQLFGQVSSNFNDPVNARKASIAINAIDDAVESLKGIDIKGGDVSAVNALNYGRQEWARARKFERVADIIKKSDGDANYLKRELNKMINDPRKSRGFNDAEKAALKQAGTLNTSEAIMKTLGRFGFDAGNSRIGSGVGALVGGGAAGLAGGTVAGVTVPAVGTAARYGQKLAARGKAENLLSVIEGVSPNQTSALPAIIGSRNTGQLAAPAGMVSGGQSEPVMPSQPMQAAPALDFNDLIPQAPLSPISSNAAQSSLMDRIKQAESSGNPNAKNSLSSASGLYQFTNDTWRSVVDKFGRKYGIRYSDKNNPAAQEKMVQYLTQDNARILRNKGIEPSDANLYFAHFMGAPAASKAISMLGKNAIAARSFPKAAQSNPTIFFDGKRPRTIDEVYELITSKVV